MSNIIDHIGETNIANNGMKMTIIAYRRSKDIDIQFEDGVVVYNKNIADFRHGRIGYPTDLKYIGMSAFNTDGEHAIIIEYKKKKKVVIQFDDGSTKQVYIQDFKRGIFKHPKYENEENENKNKNKIFKNKCKNANVEYSTALRYRKRHPELTDEQVIEYYIKNKNKYKRIQADDIIGLTKTMNNGMKATIINCRKSEDIDVQFEDGEITYNKRYSSFIIGNIGHPTKKVFIHGSFSHKCELAGINLQAANTYKHNHPELSDDEIINIYVKKKQEIEARKGESLKEAYMHKLEKAGIKSVDYAYRLHIKNPEYTFDEIIDITNKKDNNDKFINDMKKLSEELNVSYEAIKQHAYSTKDKNINTLREYYVDKKKKEELNNWCKDNNIRISNLYTFSNKHPEMSLDEVKNRFLEAKNHKNDVTFAQMCRDRGLDCKQAGNIKRWIIKNNLTLDNEGLDEYIKHRELYEKEKKRRKIYNDFLYNCNHNTVSSYKASHKDLTDEEIIIHFRPDLYINIFGEIVGTDE